MRVATWNVWWRFGPWEERQRPIANEIDRLDADVLCLQEVWADDHGDQAEILAAINGRFVARTRSSNGEAHRFGNAVLSRWPILSSHTVVLPGVDGEPSHRSAMFAQIDVPETTQPWWVVSTHLEWRYSASAVRQAQLHAIVVECERIRSRTGDAIIVLGGDFNAVADSDEIRRLTGLSLPYGDAAVGEQLIFTDGWAAVTDDPGHTWSRANPHSANAQWPRRRLDAVFVAWPRPKPTGNPIAAELFGVEAHSITDDPGAEPKVVPSDHYGVLVQLDRRTPADLEPS